MKTDAVQPGAVIDGKFRVDRVLGMGGMGMVVAATHIALGDTVALKFLFLGGNETIESEKEAIERFLSEGRVSRKLTSRHVAKILEVGQLPENGPPYMVMELLEGRDLDTLLQSGQIPSPTDAVAWILQACDALAEAHEVGIIHRDIKPANLFLARVRGGKPIIKVLDFGVAKITTPEQVSLTRSNVVIGSVLYCSPEQLRDPRKVTPATDIYALGLTLFELLTGQPPFEARTMPDFVYKMSSTIPPLANSINKEIPQPLADIVARCLERDPAKRFQSCRELADKLRPFAPALLDVSILDSKQRGRLPSLPPIDDPTLGLDDTVEVEGMASALASKGIALPASVPRPSAPVSVRVKEKRTPKSSPTPASTAQQPPPVVAPPTQHGLPLVQQFLIGTVVVLIIVIAILVAGQVAR